MTDPHRPGYRATYDPTDPTVSGAEHGAVGTGRDFGADVFALYRAGRTSFPEVADDYATWTSATHDFEQRVTFLRSSLEGLVGSDFALLQVERIRATLQAALGRTSTTMHEVGEALVETAADFAATDRLAMREFNRLARRNADLLSSPTSPPPRPPGPDAPYDEVYVAPSLAAPADEEHADATDDFLDDLAQRLTGGAR